MEKKEVATVKAEHVMKLMSKLWDCVPDEKKQELVKDEDVTVKAIQILEKVSLVNGQVTCSQVK